MEVSIRFRCYFLETNSYHPLRYMISHAQMESLLVLLPSLYILLVPEVQKADLSPLLLTPLFWSTSYDNVVVAVRFVLRRGC